MNKAAILVGLILAAGTIALGVYAWVSFRGVEMSAAGYIAMVLGAIGTVALGAVLVGLLLYSNRAGFDDQAGSIGEEEKPPK